FRMTRSRPLRRLAPFPTRRSSDLHPLAELAQLLRRDRLAEPLLDGIEKLRLQHDQQLPLRIRRAFESEDVAQTEEPRRKILQKGDAPPFVLSLYRIQPADDGLLAVRQEHLRVRRAAVDGHGRTEGPARAVLHAYVQVHEVDGGGIRLGLDGTLDERRHDVDDDARRDELR